MRDPVLSPSERRFLADSRRAVLATVDPAGRPRLVPICHALAEVDDGLGRPRLYTPVDEKPKASADALGLARVRDVLARPGVTVLVDRWDEDWTRLGWLRVRGDASVLEPGRGDEEEREAAVALLRAKYPQYRDHRLASRPLIRIDVTDARSWGMLEE